MAEADKKKEIDDLLNEEFKKNNKDLNKKEAPSAAQKLSLLTKLKLSLLHPAELFNNLKNESVSSALTFSVISILPLAVVILGLFLLLGSLITLLFGAFLGSFFLALGGLFTILLFILIFVLQIVGTIISAAIYHVFAKLLGGKGTFSNSLTAVAYTGSVNVIEAVIALVIYAFMFTAPLLVTILIPILAIISLIFWFRIIINGFSILHEMPKMKALLVALLPIIIIVAILFFLGKI